MTALFVCMADDTKNMLFLLSIDAVKGIVHPRLWKLFSKSSFWTFWTAKKCFLCIKSSF